ncbi:MAG: hypothetical protein J6X18_17725 [Bacteroidales bacterium]|nr:hypothetical protein [Bacteroidales bacterium]
MKEILKQAAERYANSWRQNPDGSQSKEAIPVAAKRAFIAGAQWKEQQVIETLIDMLKEDAGIGYAVAFADELLKKKMEV